jgi:hypothetical protein
MATIWESLTAFMGNGDFIYIVDLGSDLLTTEITVNLVDYLDLTGLGALVPHSLLLGFP